jgi:endonuclease/exonuclease/phosphatase family metal-dependent hydrolase
VPKYIFPVQVVGPREFLLLAVWSKGGQTHNYIEAVVKAVLMYRTLIEETPTVLIGDLNSNVIWDATHPPELNHTALLALLGDLKMVSAYHSFHQEVAGQETRPTYFFHWKETRPFHIDYCFIPESWVANVRRVEVGSYEEWKNHSDHRPLLVEFTQGAA